MKGNGFGHNEAGITMAANNDKEQLSALVDDELDQREMDDALAWLAKDTEASARWARYNLIRDTLHKNLPDQLADGLQQRVHAALENEPHILAPQARRWGMPAMAKQAAGLAIAASVTAVAILGVQQMNPAQPEVGVAAIAQNEPAAKMPEKQEFERLPMLAQQPAKPKPELNPYLVKHNEYSVTTGRQGMLPYVRIVGQGGER